MNNEVIVTCAVTGAGDTLGKHPEVPVTPEQISNAAIAAAKAGASVAHIHVRDPETGLGSRDVNLFKEVVERIRDSETDVVINLTASDAVIVYIYFKIYPPEAKGDVDVDVGSEPENAAPPLLSNTLYTSLLDVIK